MIRRQIQSLVTIKRTAKFRRKLIKQSQTLRTFIKFDCASDAFLKQVRIINRHSSLTGKCSGELNHITRIKMRFGLFNCKNTNYLAFGNQWNAQPRKTVLLSKGWETSVSTDISNQNRVTSANHLMQKGAVFNCNGQTLSLLIIIISTSLGYDHFSFLT